MENQIVYDAIIIGAGISGIGGGLAFTNNIDNWLIL